MLHRIIPFLSDSFNIVRLSLYAILLLWVTYLIDYGLPGVWYSDELPYLSAAMVQDGTIVPPHFFYPAGLLTNLTAIILSITRLFSDVDLVTQATYIARYICATMFIGMILCLEHIAKLFSNKYIALASIPIFGGNVALVHHAHIATPQISLTFFMALALMFMAIYLKTRSHLYFYAFVAACAMTVGAKYVGVFWFPVILVLFLQECYRNRTNFKAVTNFTIATTLSGVAGFFIFNPGVLFDVEKLINNLFEVADVEAPHFVTGEDNFAQTLIDFWNGTFAFYTPVMTYTVVIGACLWILISCGLVMVRTINEDIKRLSRFTLLTAIACLSYLILQDSINIDQSRYFIPSAFLLLCIFTFPLLFFASRPITAFNKWLSIGLIAPVMGVLIFTSSVNGYWHSKSLGESGRMQAESWFQDRDRSKSNVDVVILSYGLRTPVREATLKCDGRCVSLDVNDNEFTNVNSIDDHIDLIFDRIAYLAPEYVVVEDIVFHWRYFVPEDSAYSQRFSYEPLGQDGWKERFSTINFDQHKRFSRINEVPIIDSILGRHYTYTLEGIGGDIFIFKNSRDGNG